MHSFENRVEEIKRLDSYTILSQEEIEEVDALAVILEHKKTKARVFTLLCDDENKVFTIGFRTPSQDSTGVAHILEHCVLCGSKKFDVKDPFKELVKGSLNTFLNAMTYPDKTIYPVASCNDKDFQNLCDVYLDAVFHPNIYKEEKIFKQEGWHYEMKSPSDDLIINGVVYNEMKGVFSSADGVLERSAFNTLFSGHSYGEESGGDPHFIPELTYEAFLDFHGKYYHPSNSFIYLYGNMDMAKKLDWIDESYLSAYDYREIDSRIKDISPWKDSKEVSFSYSIMDNENTQNATYLSLHTVVGCELDPIRYMGFQILDYVLLTVPGAPIREALTLADIGEAVYGGYENGIKEPYFSIVAKNTNIDKKEAFVSTIKDTLRTLVKKGLDKEALKAAINITEFRAREADYGNYPKGLMYGLECFNSWLYDASPTMHLKYNSIFTALRENIDKGFFEELIRTYLLDNPHEALIILEPVKGLTQKKEQELKEKLEKKREGLSNEEIAIIIKETEELKAYQDVKSSPEDLLKIPMLKREELGKEASVPVFRVKEKVYQDVKIPVIHSDIFTSGISYIKVLFDIGFADEEELGYISLLKSVLGYIDTDTHSYADLSTTINLHSGGIGFGLDVYRNLIDLGKSTYVFSMNIKVLSGNEHFAFAIAKEILTTSRLTDTKRLKEIISELRAKLKSSLVAGGHAVALGRAGGYISKEMYFGDVTKGIAYYQFLDDLVENWDERVAGVSEKLAAVLDIFLSADNMRLHVVGEDDSYRASVENFDVLLEAIALRGIEKKEKGFHPSVQNEGFMTASQVNYVARVGDFIKVGFSYTGVLKVLKVILSYDYLWNHVREKGGAYGVSAVFTKTGMAGFASYRDPNVDVTNAVYASVGEFVRTFHADEREMTKAIIGAISDLDAPLTPLAKGLRGLSAYFTGSTCIDLQKERDEILLATDTDVRALAPLLDAIIAENIVCAIGNEEQIKKAQMFKSTKMLFKN